MLSLGRRLLASWMFLILLSTLVSSAYAKDSVDTLFDDVADPWLTYDTIELDDELALGAELEELSPVTNELDKVEQVQMLTPQRSLSTRVAQRTRRSARSSAAGRASVPFMIGDTGAGTCIAIGGVGTFAIEHPTLTCSRLNISENNSPLPTDRSFISYRHFKNVTGVRVLTAFERDYNVDRLTIGMERTLLDGMCSFELRLPLERRLTSNFSSNVDYITPVPPIVEPFQGGRQNELGNVSMLFKTLLVERRDFALSAGIGTTVPTAEDFTYDYFLDNLITDLGGGFFLEDLESFELSIQNETVYLSPFLAWLWQPKKRFFHQGFLQVEVAANSSTAFVRGAGALNVIDFNTSPIGVTNAITVFTPSEGLKTEIFAQTLMRLNLGWGYILTENERARCLKQLTGMFEIHYTTTLQDAKISSIPLSVLGAGSLDDVFTFGNPLNRTDILNVVVGLSANLGSEGRTVVTNGLAMPVSQGEERAFDLEYNLQIQRVF